MPVSTSNSQSANYARGYQTALLCALILATTAIFIRYLTQTYNIPPLVLAFWRDAFTAGFLFLVLRLFSPQLLRVKGRHLIYLIIYGLIVALFNSLWTLSVALNGAAIATVLVYSSGAFTALLGWWLLKESLGWIKLLVVVFSLGGCTLISGVWDTGAWQTNLVGILAGILSGLCYALYSLFGRSASQRGLNPWTTLLYSFGFATGFLLLFNLLPGQPLPGAATYPADFFWLGNSFTGWGILFLLAIGPTLVGYGLYNVSLVYLPSSVVNLIATLEPVFTAIIAYFLLGERLSGIQLLGSGIILTGIAFLRIYDGWIIKEKGVGI